jgi:hypothetical protein
MSTRSSIYHHDPLDGTPKVHIYYELLDESPDNVRIEIDTGYTLTNIAIPVTLQQRLGLVVSDLTPATPDAAKSTETDGARKG